MDAARIDRERLMSLVSAVHDRAFVRKLGPDDTDALLALDAAARGDYPGGVHSTRPTVSSP